MTAYRRLRLTGGTYFFTMALEWRGSTLLIDHIDLLRSAYRQTCAERPFACDAMVVLPDHLHAVWTLPEGDADFSTRWGAIKGRFTRAVKARIAGEMGETPILRTRSKIEKGDGGIWQRRFWEHCCRDTADRDAHIRYCWANPVRHGLVERPTDWVFSSIHRDIRAGRVEAGWQGVEM